jgi:iron complex outermembrane recepter protein
MLTGFKKSSDIAGKLLIGVSIAAFLPATAALAQGTASSDTTVSNDALGSDSASLGDIVVTAQRRSENLQSVPAAVTAVSIDRLKSASVTTLVSLGTVAPSVNVTDSAGTVVAYVRGVGSTNTAPGFYSSTAIYYDGLYISRLSGAGFNLDDVESLQILAGPQGALFGRNATAGAIIVTTKTPKPGDPLNGRLEARYGTYNDRSLTAVLASGLSDSLALSLKGNWEKRDGFLNNINPVGYYQDDGDDRNSWNIGGKLAWVPASNFKATLALSYVHVLDRSGGPYVPVDLNTPGPVPGLNNAQSVLFGLLGQVGFTNAQAGAAAGAARFPTKFGDVADASTNAFQLGALPGKYLPGAFHYTQEFRAGLNMTYTGNGYEIVSQSGYTYSLSNLAAAALGEIPGSTGLPNTLSIAAHAPSRTYEQELHVASTSGPINWIAGVNAITESGDVTVAASLPINIAVVSVKDTFTDTAYAGYAQATIPLMDKLKVTLGGRYTTEKYKLTDLFPGSTIGTQSRTFNKFTYTARLEFKPSDDVLLYAGTATGFKSGNLNAVAPGGGSVGPEVLTSYEVGLKSEMLDRKLRINGAGYYYNYDNIQSILIGNTGAVLVGGLNGRVYGVEMTADAQVTPNLVLGAAFNLLHSEYLNSVKTPDGVPYNAKGHRLAGASNFSANLNGTYTIPMHDDSGLAINASASYNGGFWFEGQNIIGTGGTNPNSFTLVNFRVTYTLPGGKLSVAAYGSNVFNTQYYRAGVLSANISRTVNPGMPSQFGGSLQYKF